MTDLDQLLELDPGKGRGRLNPGTSQGQGQGSVLGQLNLEQVMRRGRPQVNPRKGLDPALPCQEGVDVRGRHPGERKRQPLEGYLAQLPPRTTIPGDSVTRLLLTLMSKSLVEVGVVRGV